MINAPKRSASLLCLSHCIFRMTLPYSLIPSQASVSNPPFRQVTVTGPHASGDRIKVYRFVCGFYRSNSLGRTSSESGYSEKW